MNLYLGNLRRCGFGLRQGDEQHAVSEFSRDPDAVDVFRHAAARLRFWPLVVAGTFSVPAASALQRPPTVQPACRVRVRIGSARAGSCGCSVLPRLSSVCCTASKAWVLA